MMTMMKIATYLNLLVDLDRKATVDLLVHLSQNSKEFMELLAITHLEANRKILGASYDSGYIHIRPMGGSFIDRVKHLFTKDTHSGFSEDEYFVLVTLIKNKKITQTIRDTLYKILGYRVQPLRMDSKIRRCIICNYPSKDNICPSCSLKNKKFTEYRRESFIVPINYLNYNIRDKINIESHYQYYYKDWAIEKKGNTVSFTLLNNLTNSDREDYPLPFQDYQIKIL